MMIYASTLSEGLLISLFSVIIVFILLGFIAFTIQLLKYIQEKPIQKKPEIEQTSQKPFELSDIKDEDMMVAALVASIAYYEETKKDVRVVSIKELNPS